MTACPFRIPSVLRTEDRNKSSAEDKFRLPHHFARANSATSYTFIELQFFEVQLSARIQVLSIEFQQSSIPLTNTVYLGLVYPSLF